MRDATLELVRHFLLKGAEDAGLEAVARTVRQWRWSGPGVWLNVDASVGLLSPQAFEAARRAARALGDEVGLDYLARELQGSGITWTHPQPVGDILSELQRLEAHVKGTGATK